MTGRQRARPVLYAVLSLMVGVLAVGVLAMVVQTFTLTSAVREAQQRNSPILAAAQQAAAAAERGTKRIESCTTPGDPCYQQSRRQTAEALRGIDANDRAAAAAAAACAAQIAEPTYRSVLACMNRTLEP